MKLGVGLEHMYTKALDFFAYMSLRLSYNFHQSDKINF